MGGAAPRRSCFAVHPDDPGGGHEGADHDHHDVRRVVEVEEGDDAGDDHQHRDGDVDDLGAAVREAEGRDAEQGEDADHDQAHGQKGHEDVRDQRRDQYEDEPEQEVEPSHEHPSPAESDGGGAYEYQDRPDDQDHADGDQDYLQGILAEDGYGYADNKCQEPFGELHRAELLAFVHAYHEAGIGAGPYNCGDRAEASRACAFL